MIVVPTLDRLGPTVRDTLNLNHELAERKVGVRNLAEPINVDSSNPDDPMAQLAVVLLGLFGEMARTYTLEHSRAVATAKGGRVGRPGSRRETFRSVVPHGSFCARRLSASPFGGSRIPRSRAKTSSAQQSCARQVKGTRQRTLARAAMWSLVVAFLAVAATAPSARGDRILVERPAAVNQQVIVALGDSLTAGIAGTPGNYPAVLATLLPSPWQVVNSGVAGNTTVDMLGRFDQAVTRFSPQYVIVLAGINDDLLGQTPAQIEGHLSELYQDVVAIGATPIPVTLPPGGRFVEWTPETEVTRLAVNVWIRQQPYVYVDASSALADPADPEDLEPGYDAGDGIHLNSWGQAALADAVMSQGLGLPAPSPPAPTSVAVPSSSENPSGFGASITFSTTVSNASASSTASLDGGTVTFNEGSTTLCTSGPLDASGSASCSTSALPVGSQAITATYYGDTDFAASGPSSPLEQTVVGPPTVNLMLPTDGSAFYQGQLAGASYFCADGPGGPGLATRNGCAGSLAAGSAIDTSTAGWHSFEVTATSQDGLTATVTSYYDVVGVPASTTPAAISGDANAGGTVSCWTGSTTNDPTGYAYQWDRDGTPIADATAAKYTIATSDEGLTLTCTVTAINGAGAGNPTRSSGILVPVPFVPRCPGATGTLSAQTVGLVRLGMTRAQTLKVFKYSATRGNLYEKSFCLTPIGIRVGYASPELLNHLPSREQQRLDGRVIWISTSNGYYSLDGIRAGAGISAAAKTMMLEPPFHLGANYWYLAPDGPVTAILKVRGGIVQEIGIADKQLTHGARAQRLFLTSFS